MEGGAGPDPHSGMGSAQRVRTNGADDHARGVALIEPRLSQRSIVEALSDIVGVDLIVSLTGETRRDRQAAPASGLINSRL